MNKVHLFATALFGFSLPQIIMAAHNGNKTLSACWVVSAIVAVWIRTIRPLP